MLRRPSSIPLVVAAVSVVAVVGLASSGLLGPRWSPFVDDAGQFFAALAATLACWITAGWHSGGQRWWRVWMGAATFGWMIGQFLWSWYHCSVTSGCRPVACGRRVSHLPVFALRRSSPWPPTDPRSACVGAAGDLVMILDGLMVVGALFVLSWATALGAVVRTGAATPFAYSVAIAYPVTDCC